MEAYGAYSVTLDPKHRFSIPTSYELNPDKELFIINPGNGFVIEDSDSISDRMKKTDDPRIIRHYKAALTPLNLRTTRRVVMPIKYYQSSSIPNKMIMLGQDTHILLLTPSQFEARLKECDSEAIVTRSPKNRIVLSPNGFVGSSFKQTSCFDATDKKVDNYNRITALRQAGFRTNEKLYCIFNKVGLELYHEWTFLEFLESLTQSQYKEVINFVFTLSTDNSGRLGIPFNLEQYLVNSGNAEIVKTDFGAIVAFNTYEHNSPIVSKEEKPKVLKHAI